MRLVLKHKILSMIGRMEDSQKVMEKLSNYNGMCRELLAWLQQRAIDLGTLYEQEENYDQTLIEKLEKYCEYLYLASMEEREAFRAAYDKMQGCLEEIRNYVIHEIPTRTKVAFFPYKYSMWDSLESVWKAASQQPDCICQLVPIPYYDLKDGRPMEPRHYEGAKFAENYPILDYREYDLGKEKPDIIYIHNPFDSKNRLTQVEPRFFASELKRYDNVLVYIPYYMSGYCDRYENVVHTYRLPGSLYSDYVVLQSEELKKAYEFCGFPESKLLVTGSPKVDYVHEIMTQEAPLNERWKKVIQNRKVILLNTSIHSTLNNQDWIQEVREQVLEIIQDPQLALIWRPHPLLDQTIKEMRPEYKHQYEQLKKEVQNAENAVIDDGEDFADAFRASDAMISDYSSLVLQYSFTGKPVFLLTERREYRERVVFCNYYSNYFKSEGITVGEFVQRIKDNKDERKELRMKELKESVMNMDGTCGVKTHAAVLQKICFWGQST